MSKNIEGYDFIKAFVDIAEKNGLKTFGGVNIREFGNTYCPVLGGKCKYMQDGKCTAAVCERSEYEIREIDRQENG